MPVDWIAETAATGAPAAPPDAAATTGAIPRMLRLQALAEGYASGAFDPVAVADEILRRLEPVAPDDRSVWISRVPPEALRARAAALAADPAAASRLPLYGIPFAISDSIDAENMETTDGCPASARVARRDSEVVARTLAAGAMLVGKTNLDQFSTGLTGTRSPYGTPSSVFSETHISGGSNSGAAVAIASGLASFAFGCDGGGAGRVPAALNNLVGIRPTRGLISMHGVACHSTTFEVVAVMALEPGDIETVIEQVAGVDRRDTASRAIRPVPAPPAGRIRIGVPPLSEWSHEATDGDSLLIFNAVIQRLTALGGTVVGVPFAPFAQAGRLFVRPSFVAERVEAVGELAATGGEGLDPYVCSILVRSGRASARELFRDLDALSQSRREAEEVFEAVDMIMVPTVFGHPTFAEVAADPIGRNLALAHFTGFVNMLDLVAVTVPAGFTPGGMPFGVQLIGPPGSERVVLGLAGAFHAHSGGIVGAGPEGAQAPRPRAGQPPRIAIAVAAAHMTGMPLHHELLDRGATFRRTGRTAACYRLHALKGTEPVRAGLVHREVGGEAIAVELWELPPEGFGRLVAAVPRPLAIGRIRLETGEEVAAFLLQPDAIDVSTDISRHGDWRSFHQTRQSPPRGASRG